MYTTIRIYMHTHLHIIHYTQPNILLTLYITIMSHNNHNCHDKY